MILGGEIMETSKNVVLKHLDIIDTKMKEKK